MTTVTRHPLSAARTSASRSSASRAWRAGLLLVAALASLLGVHSPHGLLDGDTWQEHELVAGCEHQGLHFDAASEIRAPECPACLLSLSLAGADLPVVARLDLRPTVGERVAVAPAPRSCAPLRLVPARGPPAV